MIEQLSPDLAVCYIQTLLRTKSTDISRFILI